MAVASCSAPASVTTSDLASLHAQWVAGNQPAFEAIVERLFQPLLQEVTHQFPRIDEQILCDGVVDAVLAYGQSPERYDPTKGVSLRDFLRLVASRRVLDLHRSVGRRQKHEHQL